MSENVTSAEQIQKAPKQPKDMRSDSERALTRHVDNFEMPEQPDAAGAEPETALPDDFKLPKTLKATHELLEKVHAEQPVDGKSANVKSAKLSAIMAHLALLGAGPATPTIKMAAFKDITGAQSEHAFALKLEFLSRSHPEVKQLMEKCAALEAEIETLKK